ncbi:MAG: radical SAM protein [Anaerolineae bacterium]|jgi:radical SAM protein with 4Fe4S-binding SPASM domain
MTDYIDHAYRSIFAIPLADKVLLYAPIHNLTALVNTASAKSLQASLLSGQPSPVEPLSGIAQELQSAVDVPQPRQGDFVPTFLGILPTRGCNFSCRYCGFLASEDVHTVMQLDTARDAVNWYMDQVDQAGKSAAEIHFFGGEPFCAEEILDFTVNLARVRSEATGCDLRFEVATNGAFNEARCHWAADHLHTIVLSLDGPAEIQNCYRPYKDGRGSFETVVRNAHILAESPAELFLRACVTAETVDRMDAIAAWFCEEIRPAGICFEPLQPTLPAVGRRLEPPDPWAFARGFIRAVEVMASYGVQPVHAAADIATRRVTFCPVGDDVAIVAPDGTVVACYLLRREWEVRGMDLRLGRIVGGDVQLDASAVAAARAINVHNKPLCQRCFCRWHCAGGCHVNHVATERAGPYDGLCVQTRVITLWNILQALEQADVGRAWLDDWAAVERAVRQPSDRLVDLDLETWA